MDNENTRRILPSVVDFIASLYEPGNRSLKLPKVMYGSFFIWKSSQIQFVCKRMYSQELNFNTWFEVVPQITDEHIEALAMCLWENRNRGCRGE